MSQSYPELGVYAESCQDLLNRQKATVSEISGNTDKGLYIRWRIANSGFVLPVFDKGRNLPVRLSGLRLSGLILSGLSGGLAA